MKEQTIHLGIKGDGDNGDVGSAYVYLPLYEGDAGSPKSRTGKVEFTTRRPKCASDFSTDGISLLIANSGLVPSDLVMIEYQLVYCTYSGHQAGDGFTISHAGEIVSAPFDSYLSIDYVPAKSAILKRIQFKPQPYPLANLYFRARVSTIWSPDMPMDKWDFAKDPAVTEVHLRLTP